VTSFDFDFELVVILSAFFLAREDHAFCLRFGLLGAPHPPVVDRCGCGKRQATYDSDFSIENQNSIIRNEAVPAASPTALHSLPALAYGMPER
jgi:hypothetical protein